MSTLPFNEGIPQGANVISQTQNPILQNFQSIDKAFDGPTGTGSGGGNFTTYNIQATTPGFSAKPVNPIAGLYSIASPTNSNPELAWINNINATGSGPYQGVQITGGGITAAAWFFFVNGTPPSGVVTYNCSVTRNSVGNFTVTFSRAFTSANYAAIINGYQTGSSDGLNRHINLSAQLVGAYQFNTTIGAAADQYSVYSGVFFGTLV